MTDRALPGGSPPSACPFLALEEDRDRRSAVPDGRHRCYAEPTPHPRALTYQESYCLSSAFSACRSFLDWAARAAAEPLAGEHRASAALPLVPVPTPPPAVAAAPTTTGWPDPMRLPPPPAGYTPPPAWQPPGVAQDPTTFTWASPPPWVAAPAMRSTAALPATARTPLDPERPGWGSSLSPSAAPVAATMPDDDEPYPEWPPTAPARDVTGTFAQRRATSRPVAAAAVPAGPAVSPPGLPAPPPGLTVPPASAPTASAAPVAPAVAIPIGPDPASLPGGPAAATPDATWREPWAPAPSEEPAAATLADRPGWSPTPDPGMPPPVEAPPDPASAGPAMPVIPPADRRPPTSRWLPSFLSRDDPPPEPSYSAMLASATSAEGASAPGPADPWSEDGVVGAADGADRSQATWSEGETARPGPATAGAATAVAPEASGTGGPAPAVTPTPSRRRRLGVPMDSRAPAAVGPQTAPASRARGSGEWNAPRQARRSGWRRVVPAFLPPVALGALALLLGAAVLFLMPGFLLGGGATPPPTLPAGVVSTSAPLATEAPDPTGPAFRTYTVQGGDTLLDIARRFAVTQEQLQCVNRALRRNPNLLSIGQELRIPPEDFTCPTPTKKP